MEREHQLTQATTTKMNVKDFASYVVSLTDARVAGIFLERKNGRLQPVLRNMHAGVPGEKGSSIVSESGRNCCGKCRDKEHQIIKSCSNNKVTEKGMADDTDETDAAIIKESRFSDLLIIDAEMSFDNNQVGVISDFTKAILTKSECPVMIAPYAFEGIEEIIFAYDGSASAVFAIKQFALLFPVLTDKKLTIVQVAGKEDEYIKDRNNILALLRTHFSVIAIVLLTGEAGDELFKYLERKKNVVVVIGAFGPHLSLPFRQSTAAPLVKTVNLPLFIAHQQ